MTNPAQQTASLSSPDAWILVSKHAGEIRMSRHDGMTATILVMGKDVRAHFNHDQKHYARAEAARCFAAILDTIADFQQSMDEDTAFEMEDPILDMHVVTARGDEAVVAFIGEFGDAFANVAL